MKCSICWLGKGEPDDAVTVINGHAVCPAHVGAAMCGDFKAAVRSAAMTDRHGLADHVDAPPPR